MTPGEMFTVTPHVVPHGAECGTWHCRIVGGLRDGNVTVQEMKPADGTWKPGMSTRVHVAALVPLAVQVDLFGNPAPPDAGARRRSTNRIAA